MTDEQARNIDEAAALQAILSGQMTRQQAQRRTHWCKVLGGKYMSSAWIAADKVWTRREVTEAEVLAYSAERDQASREGNRKTWAEFREAQAAFRRGERSALSMVGQEPGPPSGEGATLTTRRLILQRREPWIRRPEWADHVGIRD